MTKKQKLIEQIKNLLREKGATVANKLVHDIYLIRSHNDAWYGKIVALWLADDGTPKCYIWYWGTGEDENISTLTYKNLEFVKEYLVKGYVIQ